jgi:hypothetical protein
MFGYELEAVPAIGPAMPPRLYDIQWWEFWAFLQNFAIDVEWEDMCQSFFSDQQVYLRTGESWLQAFRSTKCAGDATGEAFAQAFYSTQLPITAKKLPQYFALDDTNKEKGVRMRIFDHCCETCLQNAEMAQSSTHQSPDHHASHTLCGYRGTDLFLYGFPA